MPIYSIDKSYLSYAIGTDLTSFDNTNYVVLAAGELQATDLLDADAGVIGINYSDPDTVDYYHMSASQYAGVYYTGYKRASVALPMYLQTGVFLYALLGTCATTGAYTHTIALNTSQTPIYLAFHWEKELTGQDLRYDFFGYMPKSWNLRCGEDKSRWVAKQTFMGDFACSDATAADIAEPAKQTLTSYNWSDLKHASGVLTIKYNGTDLEFDIRGLDLTLTRTKPLWGACNASGFPSEAFIAGLGIDLKLDGYVKGDNVRTLMATKPEDYVSTYLDASIVFYKSATRSFTITLSNIYLIPDDDIMSSTEWYEKKTLKFKSFSTAAASPTSVSSVVVDSLDKTYYEND